MPKAKPVPANEKEFVFSEGIDYSKTSKSSIWGKEDTATVDFLKRVVKKGTSWVNLAAGDGRYNNLIANTADNVLDVDIDQGALDKLFANTPVNLQRKLELKVFNLVKSFPLDSNSYDGVFNSGTLYLFPEMIFNVMATEISRILRVGGKIAIEFSINIKRIDREGQRLVFGEEPMYTKETAIKMLNNAFPNFNMKYTDGDSVVDDTKEANPPYMFYCDTLLVEGTKVS
ncbi:methyltransferase domain-containing protein [Candidatus Dojkabacteria bacterium]|nr:methyltransferase domain-containing protein [Candidatus Dojkabacteria bacterium]